MNQAGCADAGGEEPQIVNAASSALCQKRTFAPQ